MSPLYFSMDQSFESFNFKFEHHVTTNIFHLIIFNIILESVNIFNNIDHRSTTAQQFIAVEYISLHWTRTLYCNFICKTCIDYWCSWIFFWSTFITLTFILIDFAASFYRLHLAHLMWRIFEHTSYQWEWAYCSSKSLKVI